MSLNLKLNLSIITIFPDLLGKFLSTGNLARSLERGDIRADVINFRDFGTGNYKQLDDYAFGSGGMLFAAPQLKQALDFAKKGFENSFVLYPSPQGQLLSQELIESLANQEHLIIICGHYEGIDERFVERYVDLEFSVGDCVLTGGEIPAMALIDSLSRLVPGVVGKSSAVVEDSFYRGMLDNPHYTRPAVWENLEVPEILLNGNENEIRKWRRSVAVNRTLTRRPDLIARADIRDYVSAGIYLALIANEDFLEPQVFADIERLRVIYGLERPFVISGNRDLRERFRHSGFRILGKFSRILESVKTPEKLLVVKLCDSPERNSFHYVEVKRKILEHDGAVLFVLSNEKFALDFSCETCGVYLHDDLANLSLSFKAAILFDRILGKR